MTLQLETNSQPLRIPGNMYNTESLFWHLHCKMLSEKVKSIDMKHLLSKMSESGPENEIMAKLGLVNENNQ